MRPLGKKEIGELLGVPTRTVHTWRNRGVLPEADAAMNGSEVWFVSTIHAWASRTGRWPDGAVVPDDGPDNGLLPVGRHQLAAMCGVEPKTIDKWRQRGRLLEPDLAVNGRDAWWPSRAREWAEAAPASA